MFSKHFFMTPILPFVRPKKEVSTEQIVKKNLPRYSFNFLVCPKRKIAITHNTYYYDTYA